ncbi:hypothetical protein ACFCX6_16425 [Streptomyces sp. NPDC056353]|uniref:hypothetical protein n=1 Tax=Streptomyces sp. NPDC056353 TaxID=3345792 RepID=UPI0035DBB24F
MPNEPMGRRRTPGWARCPPTADLWHHYGRTRHAPDRAVPDRFSWSWSQDSGPGAAVLGDITGRRVADLGAGAARHAAHLAVHHRPAHPAVQHTEIGARTPDGEVAGTRRWVLQEQVWTKLLDEVGFTRISTQTLPGGTGPRAAHALLVTAFRTDRSAA